VQMPRSSFSK